MNLGKRIDRLTLLGLMTGALYLFFMSAMKSIPLAAASTFVSLTLLKKLARRIPESPRKRRQEAARGAKRRLEQLALDDPEESLCQLRQIIERAYPGEPEGIPMEALLRHPSGRPVSADELIPLWKSHRGEEKLLVVTLSPAENRAKETVCRLSAPKTRLLDGKQLTALLMKQPPEPQKAEAAEKSSAAKRLFHAACHAGTGKCALSGGGLFLLYFVTGSLTHLVSALLLLLIACFSLGNSRTPKRLFS